MNFQVEEGIENAVISELAECIMTYGLTKFLNKKHKVISIKIIFKMGKCMRFSETEGRKRQQ